MNPRGHPSWPPVMFSSSNLGLGPTRKSPRTKKSKPVSPRGRNEPQNTPPDWRTTVDNSTPALQQLLAAHRGQLEGDLVARVLGVPPSSVEHSTGGLEKRFLISPRPLGQGQLSTVFKATRRADGEAVALKVLNLAALGKSERAMLKVKGEVAALRLVPSNPHIVWLHEIASTTTEIALVVDPSDDDLLALLEARGGRLPEPEAAYLFRQVVAGMAHLHRLGWAHRDIKPEHVSVSATTTDMDGSSRGWDQHLHARLVDFGDAARCERGDDGPVDSLTGFRGTPLYMAPEVASWYGMEAAASDGAGLLPSVQFPSPYGLSCDCWSLGVTIYVVVCGEAPWDQDTELAELVGAIKTGEIQLSAPQWLSCSAEVKALVRGLLASRPHRRLSADQTVEDPWLLPRRLAVAQADEELAARTPPATPTPAGVSPVSSNASALLVAAAEELEAMRERLKASRAAEAESAAAIVTSAKAGAVTREVLLREVGDLEGVVAEELDFAEFAEKEAAQAVAVETSLLLELATAETAQEAATRWAKEADESAERAMVALVELQARLDELEADKAADAKSDGLEEEVTIEVTLAEAYARGEAVGRVAAAGGASAASERTNSRLAAGAATLSYSDGVIKGLEMAEAAEAEASMLREQLEEERSAHAATRALPDVKNSLRVPAVAEYAARTAVAEDDLEDPANQGIQLFQRRARLVEAAEQGDAEVDAADAADAAPAPDAWTMAGGGAAFDTSVFDSSTDPAKTVALQCMSLIMAELSEDIEAATPLREQLNMSEGETRALVQPFSIELSARDERIAELEAQETQLRLDLQAKRQRVIAAESTAERAQDHADSMDAAVSELRQELERRQDLEATTHEAEQASTRDREKAQASLETIRLEQQQRLQQRLAEVSEQLAQHKAELAKAQAARDEALATRDKALAVNADLSGACDSAVAALTRSEEELARSASRAAPLPDEPPAGSSNELRVANCELRRQLAIRINAEDEAKARRAVDLQVISAEISASERTGVPAVDNGMWERRVTAAAAAAAAAARTQTEDEWRGHLERAVLLTRQEDRTAPPRATTPQRYLAGSPGRMALLSDLDGLAHKVGDIKLQSLGGTTPSKAYAGPLVKYNGTPTKHNGTPSQVQRHSESLRGGPLSTQLSRTARPAWQETVPPPPPHESTLAPDAARLSPKIGSRQGPREWNVRL